MLTLIVEVKHQRQRFVFAHETVTIGRHEDNDLRVSSRFVSQHHCKLQHLKKGWKIVDLESQNGTRVNGVEITQKMLKIGDRIEVGQVTIYFGEAPDEVTESLDPGTDELTPASGDDVTVSASSRGDARGALHDEMTRVLHEFRKTFGDEQGIEEAERSISEASAKLFPRRAFAWTEDATALTDIARAIASERNLKRCLTLIMDAVIAITDAERGFLISFDEKGHAKVKVARNYDAESVTKADLKISHSLVEQVQESGKPIIAASARSDERFAGFESVESLKLLSVLCLPFRIRERVIGLLYLDHRFKRGAFTKRHLEILEAFADQAAIAIENARLFEENRKAQEELERRRREVEELNCLLEAKLAQKKIDPSEVRSFAPKRDDFRFDYSFIIGNSPKMLEIFQLLDRVIPSDVPVLITGESGTGKELIAKAIHVNSPRQNAPFVKENCAAIPETLLESELFGYKKGAFTGADRDKIGLFRQTHGGTLFLDEIGETSLEMQKKLLRVLQESEIRPVGARETQKVDVRLVSASNKDLKRAVEAGEFREDLFYRINVITIRMPPLRERLEDIPALVRHFLDRAAEKAGTRPKIVDDLAMRYLLQHTWKGNVRELENEIQRACAIGGDILTADDFSPEIVAGKPAPELTERKPEEDWRFIVRETAHQKEREIILKALEEAGWKKAAAARALGISRPTLDGKIKAFGLGPYIKRGKMGR